MRRLWIVAIAALLGSAPAAAQRAHGEHQMPMQGEGMQHCMAMMGGASPHMLLQHGEALGLTAAQVSQLEALQTQAREQAMPHMQPAMQAHMAAAELLKGEAPDLAGYEARLREAADHMVRAHTAMARVAVEARGVLTTEQRTALEELGGGAMAGEHGKMGDRQHGMMGGGMAGMMGCMMMDMGAAKPGARGHNH